MTFEENFPKKISDFLNEKVCDLMLVKLSLFVCRQDGVPIYTRSGLSKGLDNNSISALITGVWQAASALTNFIPNSNIEDNFRLSFDTSSRGVYILPLKFLDQEYYLGGIYYDELNPGYLKCQLRKLQVELFEFIKTLEVNHSKSDNEFLFDDISDDEVDKLFAFPGNQ